MRVALRQVCVAAVAALLFISQSPADAGFYTAEELGMPGESATAKALNSTGQAVGRTHRPLGSNTWGLFWTGGKQKLNLYQLRGGDYSTANGLNDAGEVVGSSNTATALRAFLWKAGTGMQDLGALPGDSGSEAFGINNAGTIVGDSSGPNGVQAVLWKRNGGIESLGWLPGGHYSKALAINDGGAIAGSSDSALGTHAFLWTKGTGMQDLGTLPGDATTEAVAQLKKGLDLLTGLPDGPWRRQQELDLLIALRPALAATKGHSAADVGETLARVGAPAMV